MNYWSFFCLFQVNFLPYDFAMTLVTLATESPPQQMEYQVPAGREHTDLWKRV